MNRREFTRAQKALMIRRASDAKGNIFCEGCGLNVTGKAVEIDHTIPEALILDKTRALTIEDGKVLGRDCCHRAPGGKTAQDVKVIAKAVRLELKRSGLSRSSGSFPPAARNGRASAPLTRPLPPRRMM